MKIKNWFLRGLLGGLKGVAIALGGAAAGSAVVGGYGFLVLNYLTPPVSRWLGINDFLIGFVLTMAIPLILFGFIIGVKELKPEKPARTDECPDPHSGNYHPECWDEKDLSKDSKDEYPKDQFGRDYRDLPMD